MRMTEFLAGLERDYQRLHELASTADLTAKVPTCPDWSLADLVVHVGQVYLDKIGSMRTGASPSWPPEPEPGPPAEFLARAYTELTTEFAGRPAGSATLTWYQPDQTVGFWIRRMAHETLIHRIDAELAAGVPVGAVPDDLAADGVDEVLTCFLAYGSQTWPDYYTQALGRCAGETVLIRAGDRAWAVILGPDTVRVGTGDEPTPTGATLAAGPVPMLRWLWRRAAADAPAVTRGGDPALVARLWEALLVATQ